MKLNLKGSLYVLSGAISYGILATIVKYSNHLGIHTSVLTFMQFSVGVMFLVIFTQFKNKSLNIPPAKSNGKSIAKLLAFGTSLGLTSSLYYLSIQFIPVSLGIILLMQSIWMSMILEALVNRQRITPTKLIATLTVIIGTLLATNILFEPTAINWLGILIGLGAGLSYTISMYASSNIESQLPNYVRSKYLVMGGLLAIILFWNIDIIQHFNSINILWWGTILAIFGTIVPPLLFTKGIPLIGIGYGSIIAAVEIPVSILSAHLVLGEQVGAMQWLGVMIIIGAVVVVNRKPG
ncbi:EamA family transporter [Pedobacter sp. GR22-6]|uniref:EamA family transporter n=1 Tax=Pedobacter sp. GR22-6 TaxID=3127957 RepID=UPI00307DAC90